MKYSGLLILFLALGGVLANWQLANSQNQGLYRDNNTQVANLLNQVQVTPQALGNLSDTLKQTLRLRQMNQTPDGGLAPVLIDLKPAETIQPKASTTAPSLIEKVVSQVLPVKKKPRPLRKYTVSMAFVGPGARYAVIDGQFSHEGDQLPGGGIVLSIEEGKVKLRQRGVIQTLRVAGN